MKHEQEDQNYIGVDLRIMLRDFLGLARRRWIGLVILAAVFGAVFCIRAHHSYRPMYRASSTFTVYVTDPLQSEVRGFNAATAEQMAKTFPYIFTSSALQDLVMRDLEIAGVPPVRASVMPNTNVFTLTVDSPDPQLSWEVLGSVIRHYPDVAEFVVGPTVMNLLDESGLPEEPFNRVSYTSALKRAVLWGGAVWILTLLFSVVARSTVHNEEELRRLLNIRCIGLIPAVRRNGQTRGRGCPMVDDLRENVNFSESVRLLRSRTEKEMEKRQASVLLVTSATPGEGKTTVSINLAKAMADKGRRVLIVDCDLRSPSVAKNLNTIPASGAGFTEYLSGKAAPDQLIQKVPETGLYAVFAGGPTERAAELLGSPRAEQFLEACRKQFDLVILDTPPADLLADASEVARLADGALLVIRQNYAPRTQILDTARMLTDSGVAPIGCVLNLVARSRLSGYGSSYGYGYDYGYGRPYGGSSGT